MTSCAAGGDMRRGTTTRIGQMFSFMVLYLAAAAAFGQDFPAFNDVAEQLGLNLVNVSGDSGTDYIIDVNGNGAGFFDYDRDGDVDLLIANGSTLEELANGGRQMVALFDNVDGAFVDVSSSAGLSRTGWGMGVCVADYDNDGQQDFYLTAYGSNVLFRNNGDGTFTELSEAAGVGDPRWSTNCAFGDYDLDGDVDLYVANYVMFESRAIPARGDTDVCRYMGMDVFCGPRGLTGDRDTLYRNNGDGTFTDATVEAGIDVGGNNGFGVVFSDLDNDGWPDIYVANDFMPNFLFHNNQDGTFTEMGLVTGTALNDEGREQAGMGLGVADYDADGYMDIFVTNFSRDTNTLYQNLGGAIFLDSTASAGLGEASFDHLGWGAGFTDLDNDGWLDIFVANGHVYPEIDTLNTGRTYRQRKEIYHNLGGGRFEEIAVELGGDLLTGRSARGTAFGDYDNDGDVDIVVVNMNDTPSLYRNDDGARHWITLQLEGTISNRDAIGARVELTAGGRTRIGEVQSGGSYLSHSDMRVHFGLGDLEVIERLRVHWPGGATEDFEGVVPDQIVTIREGDGVAVQP